MAKPALGRGLGALLGSIATTETEKTPEPNVTGSNRSAPPEAGRKVLSVPLARVRPSSLQPRQEFAVEALQELADSIRAQGILQPLVVRTRDDFYELIAGERRWRAAQLIGLQEVPVLVREADDPTVLELMLIENLQRENLNPLEEAQGYAQLIEQFHLTQEDAAQKVGRSRAVVANALRLLKLSPEVQNWIRGGQLSVGHAKVILGLDSLEAQQLAAERILRQGLNVRQTEDLVARMLQGPLLTAGGASTRTQTALPRDIHVADLENQLQQRLGTKVALRYRRGKGSIEIRFFDDNDLKRLLEIFGIKED